MPATKFDSTFLDRAAGTLEAELTNAKSVAEKTNLAKSDFLSGLTRKPRTLLYVEDNLANLQLIEHIIARRSDIRLLSARNGPIGIELARAWRPDVILMDINLPGMSGIRAMQILRADTATAHIPVVALSINAMPRDIERGLEAGFFRYLTKPIKVNEFMDTLDVALKFAEQEVGQSGQVASRLRSTGDQNRMSLMSR